MTLRWIGFAGLLGELVSRHGVASVVATLLPRKGPKGFVHGEAWWEFGGIEVFQFNQDNAAQATQGGCREDSGIVLV